MESRYIAKGERAFVVRVYSDPLLALLFLFFIFLHLLFIFLIIAFHRALSFGSGYK